MKWPIWTVAFFFALVLMIAPSVFGNTPPVEDTSAQTAKTTTQPAPHHQPPVLRPGGIPRGTLGHPLGTYLTVKGTYFNGGKQLNYVVDTVNGKKLAKPTFIHLTGLRHLMFFLMTWHHPKSQVRLVLKGYEAAEMGGWAPARRAAAKEAGNLLGGPQAVWGMYYHFHALSAVSIDTVPARPMPLVRSNRVVPIGRLGFPLGSYITIEATRVVPGTILVSTNTYIIDVVNGHKLPVPLVMQIDGLEKLIPNVLKLPAKHRVVLRGYETMQMIGQAPAIAAAAKEADKPAPPQPQKLWQVSCSFVALRVASPGPHVN